MVTEAPAPVFGSVNAATVLSVGVATVPPRMRVPPGGTNPDEWFGSAGVSVAVAVELTLCGLSVLCAVVVTEKVPPSGGVLGVWIRALIVAELPAGRSPIEH